MFSFVSSFFRSPTFLGLEVVPKAPLGNQVAVSEKITGTGEEESDLGGSFVLLGRVSKIEVGDRQQLLESGAGGAQGVETNPEQLCLKDWRRNLYRMTNEQGLLPQDPNECLAFVQTFYSRDVLPWMNQALAVLANAVAHQALRNRVDPGKDPLTQKDPSRQATLHLAKDEKGHFTLTSMYPGQIKYTQDSCTGEMEELASPIKLQVQSSLSFAPGDQRLKFQVSSR